MDAHQWQKVQSLFHQAVDLPEGERTAFVRGTGVDTEIADAVLAMLAEDGRHGTVVDGGMERAAQTLWPADAHVPPANQVGPYEVGELLGDGGMGVVFRARRRDLDNVVAIKFLKDAKLSPARRERFEREQRALAQLNHPAIAQLHDANTLSDGTPYIIMEYVEGKPITDYCRDRGSPLAERLRLFRSVCEAVQFAHRNLIVHRDLKPSNVLVTSEGQVKLLDFGISKRLDATVTQDGRSLPMMTPAYAAPEQLRDEEPSVETDVYALGLTLYELLTGHPPIDFKTRPAFEALHERLTLDPPKPSQDGGVALARALGDPIGRGQWDELDTVTLTALDRDRERRYRGVEALLRDLDHYQRREPLEARPASLGYQTRKFLERNGRWVGALAAGLVVMAGLVGIYTVRLKRARDAAVREVERTRRIETFMFGLFDDGDHTAGINKNLRAVTLVEHGVKEARSMQADPQVQADLQSALGNIWRRLGDPAQAEGLLLAASSQRQRLFGANSPEASDSLMDLAELRSDQSRPEDAERLARQAQRAVAAETPREPRRLARADKVLGHALIARGAFDAAVLPLQESVTLFTDAAPNSPDLSSGLVELSHTHFYAGRYDKAQALMEQALSLDRTLHGEEHPTVSADYFDLGAIPAERGYNKEAEAFYRKGLAITERWYGDDNDQTAADIIVLERALYQQNQFAEALDLAKHALVIRERVWGESNPKVASVLNELGNLARSDHRLDEARSYYERNLKIYRSAYPHGHYLIGLTLTNLASIRVEDKNWSEAEKLLREALGVYHDTLPADHMNVAIARMRLGRTLLGEQRYPEALTESVAAYQRFSKDANPSVKWLKMTREDLLGEYQALGDTALAARYAAELAEHK